MKKTFLLLGLPLLLVIAYLLLAPIPQTPQSWTPPVAAVPPAVTGNWGGLTQQAVGTGIGPEGLSADTQGRLYFGYADGRVMRLAGDGSTELLGQTGGRPLGTWPSADGGTVIVADARKGLLRLREGRTELLSDRADGTPFKFTNNLAVAADGRIYFSDSSSKYGFDDKIDDVLEHGNTGRLLRFDPATRRTEVLLGGLHVANGVALGPDEAYLLVAETIEYRVLRYWLKGDRAGQAEVFIDNLPGFPDNITYNGRDGFWLALFAPRDAMLDAALPRPWLRKIILRLPAALQPPPARVAQVLKLDRSGRIAAYLRDDRKTAYAPVTSALEVGDALWLGSTDMPSVGRLPLAGATQHQAASAGP